MQYKNLLSPCKIGKLTVKNRVVMTAMGVSLANFDGTPSDEMIAFYTERAKGGVGLIINEVTRVDDLTGVAEVRQLSVTKDENIPGLRKMTDAVHAEDALIFCQLHHPGRQTYTAFTGIDAVVSASDQACGVCQQPTRPLTLSEIHEMEQKFIDSAVRAKASGYDGVELHGAHGYLLQQFLSPYTNHRTDEYGGSLENRMRLINNIIAGIHEACGYDFPISVRISVDECHKLCGIPVKGLELDETIEMCKIFEANGVDVLNVSVGTYETMNTVVEPASFDEGWRSNYVREIKNNVSIPVMGNAVIRHPEFAEKLLADGTQDFITMGRTFLADPEWVNKTAEGRECEIRKCISCLYCFETVLGALATGDPIKCAINPRTGHELTYKAPDCNGEGRKVVVVGAGPSGLEASAALTKRGFHTVLLESEGQSGGQLNIADKPPKKQRLTELTASMTAQAEAAGVELHFNTVATPELIKSMEPYAVIIATGGTPIVPRNVAGIDSPIVYTNSEVLSGVVSLEGRKVAVIGGSNNGLETAEYLASRGNNVTIVEMLPSIGTGIYFQNLLDMTARLGALNVEMKPGSQLLEVTEDGITVKSVETGELENIQVDAIVISVGTRSQNSLAAELEGVCDHILTISDACKVGRIGDATRSALDAVYSL